MNLNSKTACEILQLIEDKKIDIEDVYNDLDSRIKAIDSKIHAYIHLPSREDIKRKLEKNSFLKGLPILVKDNICIKDEVVTCASRILEGFRPPYDATVIEKLKKAGAVVYGRANMDEFAFGSSCETSCYGPTKNPWDLDRVPGGSSGGAAAAVAADEAIWALGTDTGGSIRQPAALCGVVGLKPTYGRVSRYGLIAFASSLDQIGPITKDVRDAALLLKIIAGYDSFDSTSVNTEVPDYLKLLGTDIKGIKIGVPKEYFVEGLDRQIKEAIMAAKAEFEKLGAEFYQISLPHSKYSVAVYYILATAEASSNLARFDGVQYGIRDTSLEDEQHGRMIAMYKSTRGKGFGQEAKRRIILGTYVLSSGYYDAYYLRGLKVRSLIKKDFDEAFKECDCIMTPTSPTAAFKIGEKTDNPLAMYLSDVYTISANLAGIPAISLPCGLTKEGLPIGLQLLAGPFKEDCLLNIAFNFEQNTQWYKIKPTISKS